jgi:ATP synthase F1 delta subunit
MGTLKRERNFNFLYRKAAAQKLEEQVAEELGAFAQLLQDCYALKLFLEDIRINNDYKKKKLASILPSTTSRFFRELVNSLIDHGLVGRVPVLAAGFLKILLREKDILTGKVESAVEIGPKKRQALQSLMDKVTGKKTILHYSIKPSVLGGVRVQFVDGTLWDASLDNKLRQMYLAVVH